MAKRKTRNVKGALVRRRRVKGWRNEGGGKVSKEGEEGEEGNLAKTKKRMTMTKGESDEKGLE